MLFRYIKQLHSITFRIKLKCLLKHKFLYVHVKCVNHTSQPIRNEIHKIAEGRGQQHILTNQIVRNIY